METNVIDRVISAVMNCIDPKIEPNKELILHALMRFVPLKPKPDIFYFGLGKCPTCGAIFEDFDHKPTFCNNCGQKLDWKED